MEVDLLESNGRPAGRFSAAFPASIVSDTPHLREKTAKLGAIARACSIFGVNEIILYPDDPRRAQGTDMRFCAEILEYIETPQYLRKRLFKLSPSFRFTGILHPLQTPHHNVPSSISEIKVGDVREGVVIAQRGADIIVEAGLKDAIPCSGNYPLGRRVTLRVTELGNNLRGEIVDATKISIYWGYRVTRSKYNLASILERERFDLKIGTSRYGIQIQEVWLEISNSLKSVGSVLIAFGSPKMGLKDILAPEEKNPKDVFHFFVNTVPGQRVATIRTEEAAFISLGLLNAMKLGW